MTRLEPRFEIKPENHKQDTTIEFPLARQQPLQPLSSKIVKPEERQALLDSFDKEVHSSAPLPLIGESNKNSPWPSDLSACLSNAVLLQKNGEYKLALHLYRAVLARDAGHVVSLKGIAVCLRHLKKHKEALPYFRALVQIQDDAESWVQLAHEAFDAKDYDEAYTSYIVALERGLPDGTDLFVAYKNIGNVLLLRGQMDKASEMYDRAFALNPDSDTIVTNKACLEVQRGDLNKAADLFRYAVEINNDNDKAWMGLALVHREFGDYELAWANILKTLDLNPKNETGIRLMAEIADRLSKYGEAIERIYSYLEYHDQDAQMLFWLGKFLCFAGQWKTAEVEMNKALELDPYLQEAHEVYHLIRQTLAQTERPST